MEGPLPTAGNLEYSSCLQGTKNSSLSPTWDKSCNSCDTTQIDVYIRPLAYAYHHTRPKKITVRVSVGIYSGQSPFKPPSEVHSTCPVRL